MKGSYGSSRAYEIKIISGGEVHNLHVNEWGLLKILKLFYAYTVLQCSLDFSVLASFSQKIIELFVQILLEGVSPHG